MINKLRLLLVFALVPAAIGLVSPSAHAAQFTFPYNPNPANQCTSDLITWEGEAQIIVTVTPNLDGSFHITEHFNTMGIHGTGALGDYVYNETDNTTQEFDVAASLVDEHHVHHLNLLHVQNNLPNDDRYEHVNVHIVFNNGVPTVEHDNSSADCR
jgi:hypothetical protein